MLHFRLGSDTRPSNILLLGAHCDDIEIGCGGTLMQLVRRYPSSKFMWVTLSSDAQRAAETRAAAARLLAGAKDAVIRVEEFRGSYFPHSGAALKDYFEGLKAFTPDLILTHYRNDLHQDHRVTNELTWNTFRDHLILEYEIPKFDGDLGAPNVFLSLTRAEMKRKCDILTECFPSQAKRAWFTRETFEAIARLRGIECNAPEGYAEAFYVRKLCVNP
ncbi:MAG: PIG-L deacetylase family protein [Burkholderiales bacterium]